MISKFFFFLLFWIFGATALRAQWVQTSGPSEDYSFLAVGSKFFVGSQEGLFATSDAGTTWQLLGFDSDRITSMVLDGNKIIAGALNGEVFVSSDSGSHWLPDTNGLTGVTAVSSVARSDSMLIVGTTNGIFISSDDGASWRPTAIDQNAIPLIATDSDAYAVVSFGLDVTDDSIVHSSDHGWTWQVMGPVPNFTYSLAAIGTNVFLSMANGAGVARSTNHGDSLKFINGGLPLGNSFTCHCILKYGNDLFVGTNRGIFFTTDSGSSWSDVTDSAVEQNANGLSLFANVLGIWNNSLWAGTLIDSIWDRPLSQMTASSSVEAPQPLASELVAYPNPTRDRATIQIELPYAKNGTIAIVDVLGRTVQTIFSGELPAGSSSFSWNSEGCIAGSYACILRAEGSVTLYPISLIH